MVNKNIKKRLQLSNITNATLDNPDDLHLRLDNVAKLLNRPNLYGRIDFIGDIHLVDIDDDNFKIIIGKVHKLRNLYLSDIPKADKFNVPDEILEKKYLQNIVGKKCSCKLAKGLKDLLFKLNSENKLSGLVREKEYKIPYEDLNDVEGLLIQSIENELVFLYNEFLPVSKQVLYPRVFNYTKGSLTNLDKIARLERMFATRHKAFIRECKQRDKFHANQTNRKK